MRIVDVFKSRAGAPADHDVALADERLQSDDLLKQAQEADRAVHEQGICSSDAGTVNVRAPARTPHVVSATSGYSRSCAAVLESRFVVRCRWKEKVDG